MVLETIPPFSNVDNYDSERGGSIAFPLAKQVVFALMFNFNHKDGKIAIYIGLWWLLFYFLARHLVQISWWKKNKVGETADLTYLPHPGIQGWFHLVIVLLGMVGKEAGLGLSEMGTDLFYYGYDNKQKSLTFYNIAAERVWMELQWQRLFGPLLGVILGSGWCL